MKRTTDFCRAKRFAGAALVGLSWACSGENHASLGSERIGDTLVVRSSVTAGNTADLRQVARIGRSDGPPEVLLGVVSSFLRRDDGQIIVADDAGLRAFAPDGSFAQWIARTGQGPGEVRYVVGMDVAPDGRLFAVDLGNRRINVYDVSGASIDHWRLPDGMPGYGRGAITAGADGAVYVALAPPLPADGSDLAYPRPIFVKLSSEGVPLDTIAVPERYTERCPALSSRHWRAGFYEDLRVAYLPKVKWAVSPTGTVAVGCPASFEVDLVESDGTVVRLVLENYDRVAVPAEERDAVVELQTFSRRRNGNAGADWSWRGDPPAGEKPAYQRLIFGRNGNLWIRPAQPSEAREIPAQFQAAGLPRYAFDEGTGGGFEIFAADGRYVGAVRLPRGVGYEVFPGSADPYIRGDTVLMLVRDSLDVPFLDLFEVVWPND